MMSTVEKVDIETLDGKEILFSIGCVAFTLQRSWVWVAAFAALGVAGVISLWVGGLSVAATFLVIWCAFNAGLVMPRRRVS